jgi:hypothetical protein
VRGAAGRLIGAAAAALVLCACAAGVASAARARPRLLLDDRVVPVDAPVCVCAAGAAHPESLVVDALAPHAGSVAHFAIPWPEHGPLVLLGAIPGSPGPTELAFWGQDGSLPPGAYVLTAAGFAPETLRVREPTDPERRARAVMARARLNAEAGDSALAARLVERLRALEPGGAYDDAAFLALGRLWRYSSLRAHPETWLSMWVARHHSRCVVGEGIRIWLESVPEPEASETLRRTVSRYRDTRAADAAADWLSVRGKAAK